MHIVLIMKLSKLTNQIIEMLIIILAYDYYQSCYIFLCPPMHYGKLNCSPKFFNNYRPCVNVQFNFRMLKLNKTAWRLCLLCTHNRTLFRASKSNFFIPKSKKVAYNIFLWHLQNRHPEQRHLSVLSSVSAKHDSIYSYPLQFLFFCIISWIQFMLQMVEV